MKLLRQRNAFLLFEVLISLLILSFGMAGLIRGFHHILAISQRAEENLQAIFYAEELLARIRIENTGRTPEEVPEVSDHFTNLGFSAAIEQEKLEDLLPEEDVAATGESVFDEKTGSATEPAEAQKEHEFFLVKLALAKNEKPMMQLQTILKESPA